jgi:hypothetical protein
MNDFSAIDTALGQIWAALRNAADAGCRYDRIQSLETIMDLQLQQSTYQAALATTAKIMPPSLLDFLR